MNEEEVLSAWEKYKKIKTRTTNIISKRLGYCNTTLRKAWKDGKLLCEEVWGYLCVDMRLSDEEIVQIVKGDSMRKKEFIKELSENNRKMFIGGNYKVALIDEDNNILKVWDNRCQVVRDIFFDIDGGKEDKQNRYMSWTGSLSNLMLDGRRFQGNYYKYVSLDVPTTELYVTSKGKIGTLRERYILVNVRGEEEIFPTYVKAALEKGINMDIKYYTNTGKNIPNTEYKIFKIGTEVLFDSDASAMSHYGIGEDDFKERMGKGELIRGQRVLIKE